jgi:hypothetical protein
LQIKTTGIALPEFGYLKARWEVLLDFILKV